MATPEGWREEENLLIRDFVFNEFMDVINFVNKVAEAAESADHHPDIYIHDYKHLRISMTSHDAGNVVTQKDYSLAETINSFEE